MQALHGAARRVDEALEVLDRGRHRPTLGRLRGGLDMIRDSSPQTRSWYVVRPFTITLMGSGLSGHRQSRGETQSRLTEDRGQGAMRELKAAERALKAEKPGKAGETKEIAACDLTRVRG